MPPVIAFLPLIAGAIGAGGAILGGIQQQKVADANAQIARQQAREAQIRTTENVRRQRIQLGRLRGKQRAGFARAGVITTAGTPLLVDVTTATEGERDIALTKRAGQVEAAILTSQANLFKQRGETALGAGILKGGATLLGGAFKAGQAGAFKTRKKTDSAFFPSPLE